MATISITFTIPDSRQTDIIDAFCEKYGYDSTSGNTKIQFIKQQLAQMLKDAYTEKQLATAARSAKITTLQDINSFDIT